ncbi:RNA polymerase sigma factor [Ornithinimicrobium faecis]|uniref:RNA polymerase sigma factor n=1 Tax=Ornithinimicrobium faecis TaxID=2934158 RepID=A0ABY4YW02_9MICO|nr:MULTISPECIES: RNA polymerase sigma factor [unclassified Ornithinimicrobium]USQ80337.1 RNA polymerase sigma factor [Ornithinimicrobium sp. HY1793]
MHETEGGVEELAGAAAAGDEAALGALLERIRPEVLRRCSRVLPFHGDAEDATQDALLAVSRGIAGFEGRSKFTTWLYPLVARCAFATYRRLRDQAVPAEPDSPPIDPRRVSVLAGARVDVVEALAALREDRPHLVEAVVLRDLMGMEYAEVSERLGVPLGTVKSRINHGRSALRDLLTGHGQGH